MKSKIATGATLLALLGGTGAAIAVAGTDSSHGSNGGAASGEYKPGKGCGDKNHQHEREDECKKPPPPHEPPPPPPPKGKH